MDSDFKWRWAHVDRSGRAEQYVDLVNRLRGDDDPAHCADILAWINAQPGERLLEIGCGTGVVARAVARGVPTIREVIAVDASVAMIAEARRQTAGRGISVIFPVADAHHLPFPDGAFDRCYAMEVFVILPDPYRAFVEMARVTRPGGCICIWETDCDTLAMLGPDLDLTRRLLRFVGDRAYNGAVARQLIEWCKGLGWQVQAIPAVGASDDGALFQEALLPEWLVDAQHAGIVTLEEAEWFLADIRDRQRTGRFFSYTVSFRITATKPSEHLS